MLDSSKLFDAVGGSSREPDEGILERFREDARIDVPIELTDLDRWANYVNEDLYDMDRKVREFLGKTRYRREKGNGYRTTASVVFSWIYGRPPTPADSPACRMLNELLRYYCSSYTGPTTYKGRKVPCVYEFTKYATSNRRPYSLKLRLEECDEGRDPFRKSGVDDSAKRRDGRRKHREDGVQADG